MLAGGLVLASFAMLYQDRLYALINVLALHAVILAASVAWQADGQGLVTGDRRGHVKAWDFDPSVDGFDADTIANFATLSYEAQPGWCQANPSLAVRTPCPRICSGDM